MLKGVAVDEHAVVAIRGDERAMQRFSGA
jgi:hypothetical protein